MDDTRISDEIEQLEAEERKLRHDEEAAAAAGRGDVVAADKSRLEEIGTRLAQLWDLERQRTALRNAGGDPDDAALRDPEDDRGVPGLIVAGADEFRGAGRSSPTSATTPRRTP